MDPRPKALATGASESSGCLPAHQDPLCPCVLPASKQSQLGHFHHGQVLTPLELSVLLCFLGKIQYPPLGCLDKEIMPAALPGTEPVVITWEQHTNCCQQ